jgi:hypothetical protein
MYSLGRGAGVTVVSRSTPNLTNFTPINEYTYAGTDWVEYEQVGTGNCLEYSGPSEGPGIVIMDSCTSGRASQLWTYLGNIHNGGSANSSLLVSLYQEKQNGDTYCMQKVNGSPGINAYIIELDSCRPGSSSQSWYTDL